MLSGRGEIDINKKVFYFTQKLCPTVATDIAVAWAAIFVPFRVFLKPSIPQDRSSLGFPRVSVIVMIVLFLDTRILQIGMSLKAAPLISVFCVLPSGKTFIRALERGLSGLVKTPFFVESH